MKFAPVPLKPPNQAQPQSLPECNCSNSRRTPILLRDALHARLQCPSAGLQLVTPDSCREGQTVRLEDQGLPRWYPTPKPDRMVSAHEDLSDRLIAPTSAD